MDAREVDYEGHPLSLRAGAPTRVRLPPRALRARVRGLLFDTSKTFLLPAALNSARRLRQLYEGLPGAKVLIVGHCDRAGSDELNLRLSRRRAASVAAFLRDEVEAWLGEYEDSADAQAWGVVEDQHMLSVLGEGEGPFYAGPIDGQRGSVEAPLRRFQEWSNATRATSLVVDGIPGPNSRRELIQLYMQQDGTTLPPECEVFVHGCGEFHPEVEQEEGSAEAENRRVEVFFFEGPLEPAPQDPCPAPGCPERAQWIAKVEETVDLREQAPVAPGRVFTLSFSDEVLLPADAELVVHGLASPLRLKASEHHRAEEEAYAFPIHDPPPGAKCRGTLVSQQASQVLFAGVELARFVAAAQEEGPAPPFPLRLPGLAFQTREDAEEEPSGLSEEDFHGPALGEEFPGVGGAAYERQGGERAADDPRWVN